MLVVGHLNAELVAARKDAALARPAIERDGGGIVLRNPLAPSVDLAEVRARLERSALARHAHQRDRPSRIGLDADSIGIDHAEVPEREPPERGQGGSDAARSPRRPPIPAGVTSVGRRRDPAAQLRGR